MLLYRAVNDDDLKSIINNTDVFCSLYNSKQKDKKIKNLNIYYNLCLYCNREYALDSIIGHISGKRLGVNLSPWISSTSDFDFVVSEYAVPQSGQYNISKKRKPIIIIDLPDNKIKTTVTDVKNLRNANNIYDFAIDLSNNNLDILYDSGAISAEKYNENMPGYDPYNSKDLNFEMFGYKPNVKGFTNYSTCASEILIFGRIKKEYIKLIMYPLSQDILYSCDIPINKDYFYLINNINFLINNINYMFAKYQIKDKKLFKELYPDKITANNLTDFLAINYDSISGNTIEEKYETLKYRKTCLLKEIVNIINNILNTNFTVNKLVDDQLLVRNYSNISNLSKKAKYDLILIEKDNLIYTFDYNKKGYYNEKNNDVLLQKDIIQEIKIKQKTKKINN